MSTHRRILILSALAGLAAACFAGMADAAEIRVITTGAMKEVVLRAGASFEKETGHRLIVSNDTAGGVAKKIEAGEAFDVALITPPFIDRLIAAGKMAPGSRADIARIGMAVVVKEGAPKPDISTVDAFKAAMLAAKSVTYRDPASGGSSGIYFAQMLDRLGIGEAMKAKTKFDPAGGVAEYVAKGEAEIGAHQLSEIVPVKGVTIVGPLPKDIQNITIYSGGLAPAPKEPAAAKAFLDYLKGGAAGEVLTAVGMERVM